MIRVFIVVGSDGVVRGYPYAIERSAEDARKQADEEYSFARPHVVVPFVPERRDIEAKGYADGVEAAAALCARKRCRLWDARECARQIRERVKFGVVDP